MNPDSHNRKIKVLLVDDEELFLESTSLALAGRGCQVRIAGDAEEAIMQLESRFFDVVVLDVRMPGMDGMVLLRKLNVERPTLKVLMLTGHATVAMAIEAMKLGAFDFLSKPCKIDELIKVIGHAAEQGQLERSNIALKDELVRTKGLGVIVGKSLWLAVFMHIVFVQLIPWLWLTAQPYARNFWPPSFLVMKRARLPER